MKGKILHNINFIEKILMTTCDTLIVLDRENICVDFIMKTDNPVFNPNTPLMGKDFLSLLPEETARLIRKEINHCRRTGETSNANYDLPTETQMFYFKFIIHKFDEDFLICQYRDITQRSNMKKRLKSALMALLQVGKKAKITQWTFDLRKQELVYSGFSNIQSRNIDSPEILSLSTLLEFVHDDDKQKLLDFLLKSEREYESLEYRLKVPGERMQYIRATKYTQRIENNALLIEGFSQNVSDFIKNRHELEMVLSVVFNTPYSIHANHLDGRLVFANKECRRQNEVPETTELTEVETAQVLRHIHAQGSWEGLVQKIQEANGVLTYRCDFAYPKMDIIGSECISFIVKNGEGDDIVWTLRRDISDQLRYEEQLLKSKEAAEESEKLKSVFISNMNHEIRTPLSAIMGFSEIIADTADPALRKEYGQILNSNSAQLLRLVTDVLEMSHIDSGKMRMLPGKVSLNSVFRELYISFGQNDNSPQMCFETPEEDMTVKFDRVRIVQLLTNLINNALKFTPPSGSIHIGYEKLDGEIELYVKDTGIGIPKEKQHLVFDRFYKINDADRGTGLGLAICRSIVDQLDGSIWVESEEGRGATFKVRLPLENKERTDVN